MSYMKRYKRLGSTGNFNLILAQKNNQREQDVETRKRVVKT